MAMSIQRKALLGSAALLSTFAVGGGAILAAVHSGSSAVFADEKTGSAARPDRQLMQSLREDLLTEAAQELNLTTTALRQDLRDGKTLSQLASSAGVSTSELVSALENKAASDLQADVQSGKLTSEQASAIETRVDRVIQAWVSGTWPSGWDKVRPRGVGVWRRELIATAAKDLGVSQETLVADLHKGETLSEIATAQGVSTSTLISDLESAVQADLQKAESAGKITSSQAQAMESRIDQWISDWVNGTLPRPSGAHLPGAQPTSSSTASNATTNA
ncbi:LysM peptidoglycan-binding domain-containing protein [Alicyclobacillus fructus]|uniref:LysM peptidoglycan-binding domain-containing protein n=1 Tax=Alicyclobacillus fructus TaxID=2816082 RepID=UPI001A8C229B|nr:LysM peptidoglycan-binding domain-containing protein [Alicyclobacillus fructus]